MSERLQGDEGARAEFGLQRFQRFGAGAGEHDSRALRVQRLGDGAADAAGRAGDECGFSCEIEHQSAFHESFDVGGRIERDGLQAPCRCA